MNMVNYKKRLPKSEPRRFRQKNVPRRWRHRLQPDALSRKPKGVPDLFTRARRLFWSWWPWAAASVWMMAIGREGSAIGLSIMALVSYLAAPREHPPSYGLDHEFPVASDEFLASVAGATGVPFAGGNRVEILNNGDEFYPAMIEAINQAEESITVEAYIYWAGTIGLMFAQALAAKAREGVKVKILLDAIGSATIGEEILKTLESGGCQLAWYNPIHWYTIGRFNNRTHRKSLIIDGRIGFTGGAGIADHWLGRAEDRYHWRDIQIRIEGPGVMPLQTGFGRNWLETTGEMATGYVYYPTQEAAGDVAVQTIMSSPETGSSTVRIMYYLSIICAREYIYIANPYFVPDQAAIDTLIEAKRRGVDVKIMVSGIHNDNRLARQNGIRLYGKLLEAGVEIYEYNHTMLHHKTMVVDGVWATIGTTNFDSRSFAHNEENNVCFYDEALVEELHSIFMADLEICEKVELEAWRRRGLLTRVQGMIASMLADQV
ncbi:MAG TPA: phospholipase D-like domain-containing protein [Blastocatellia bacterium]|nr:phospholipase D-like domain-containing protein [Blastocatellia bacterium]